MQPYVQAFLREPREQRRRLVILLAAAVVLAYLPLDVHVRQGPWLDLALLRAAWAAMLLALGLAQPRLGPQAWDLLILAGAIASNAFYLCIVALVGGLATPQAIWLPVMPLATALLAWERWRAVALGGLVILAGTAGLALREGADLVVWLSLVAGTAGLAVATSFAFLVVQRDEAAAVAARDEAQARLGESERRRQRAERLAIAGRLAASVAHAVNSPLAAVKSNLHHLAGQVGRPGSDAGEAGEVLADTAAAVDQIARIVGTLRVFSQDEWAAAPPASEVAPVVAEALLAAGPLLPPGVALRSEVAPGLPPVTVGEPLLVQVVLGLLLSAAGDGRAGAPREVKIEARRDEAGVRLEVLDDGPAYTPAARSRLFDVVSATWSPGRGVGLALARELLALEGGRLEVDDRPEGGACHRLWLPAAHVAPAPPPC